MSDPNEVVLRQFFVHQDQQQATFDELLRRNRGRFAAVARVYADHDADDLLQEMLLQIWRSLNSFSQRSNIDTWCYRVALNTAMTWRRSHSRRKERIPTDSSGVDEVQAGVDGHSSIELLEKFLQTLSKSDRAMVLMYLDDLSGAEMAEVLGISEGAVRVRIHRIKEKLAQWQVGDS